MTANRLPGRAFLFLLLFAVAGLASAAVKGWTVVDLGPSSFATAINNHQDVVGYAYEPAPEHAFLWTRGAKVNIGVPPGGQDFFPTAISDRGLIVGYTLTAAAWSWEDGEWTDLGFTGQPTGVNKFGDIVGYRGTSAGTRGFLYSDGVLTEIGTLGGRESYALAINDRGQVVGVTTLADESLRAFLWDDGAMTDLGGLNGHGTGAEDINNRGQIIGMEMDNNVWYGGWLYDGAFHPIGGSSPVLFPRAINDRGAVVGEVAPPGQFPAPWPAGSFLVEDGLLTRLDMLPGIVAAGYTQVSATDISDRGWISGSAMKDALRHGFVLVPKAGR